MALTLCSSRALLVLVAFAIAMLAACATEQRPEWAEPAKLATSAPLGKLGTVEFPTTCSAEAQSRFQRGAAALHSFWYPVALDEFRAATRIDPHCMMGYWGE